MNRCTNCKWEMMWAQGGRRFCIGPQTEWHKCSETQLWELSEAVEDSDEPHKSPLTCAGQRNSHEPPFHEIVKACAYWAPAKR
jgi:hypothetical protein